MEKCIGTKVKYSTRFLGRTTIPSASTYRGTIVSVTPRGKAKVKWDEVGTATADFKDLMAI